MAANFMFIGLLFFSAILTFNVVSGDAAPESHDFISSSRALGDSPIVDDWVHEESKIERYRWVKGSGSGPVPENAIQGGLDVDHTAIYVGRAWLGDVLLPAEIIPSKDGAFVSLDGQEYHIHEYEFLVLKNVVWKSGSRNKVPSNAVVSGRTPSGESLYTGRVIYGGSITIGRIHPSLGLLFIPFGGQELSFEKFEVLIMKE